MLFFLPPTLPPALPLAAQEQQPQRQKMSFEGLDVEFMGMTVDPETGTYTFTGFVTAKYDLTVVSAQELVVDAKNKKGVASGGVELRDPEAFLRTDRLDFDWGAKTGNASNVYVQAGNMRVRAETLEITPEEWRMDRAKATLSRKNNPDYEIIASKVRIYPGRYGIAQGVKLDLFGLTLGTVPEMRFDLDPRIEGFNLPAFAERKGVGFGVSWNSSFLLNDNAVLGGTWGSFPHRFPGYGLNVIWMDADPDKTFRQLKPQDDLKEQTGDGWFDNIAIKSPRMEANSIGGARLLYMAASKWNTSTVARPELLNDVSKAYELVAESAGTTAGFGMRANVRIQSIRHDAHSPFVNRFESMLAALSPVWYLTGNFGFQVRADLFNTFSENTEFGWVRGQASLLYSPMEGIMLGAAYSDSHTYGTPDFEFDRRLYDKAVHGRLDYNRGPYTFRYLLKLDPSTGRIFDTEYEIALVAEGFQPFVVYRQFPSDFRIGVRFRIDDFVGRLQRRRVERTIDRPF
jgi:hypothetical protein